MSLVKNEIIIKLAVYAIIGLAGFLLFNIIMYFSGSGEREIQKKIFSRLTQLTTKELSSVELQFVKKDKLLEQKCFLADSDLNEFLSFFYNADFMQAGGHNPGVYQCIIVFKYKNGDEDKFVGVVYSEYEFNKDALYIYKNYFEQRDGYYLATEYGFPIRVPKLGKWIMEKCPLGKY